MSDTSGEEQEQALPASAFRLGKCEVCDVKTANYTCPKCEVKTCCVECVNIHKRELDCDGVRDRTKFIRMPDFTTSDLLSDYRLLEECARFVYAKKRDEKKKFTRIDKDLPIHLFKLKSAARNRGTALQFLTQNFTRHSNNTTFYDWKTNVISWRVEWLFPNAATEAVKFVDERCPETARVAELLEKYLSPKEIIEGSAALSYYHAAGFSGVKVFLKAEKVRGSSKKYFELDPSESLGDNLAGKCIVEFPVLCVVLRDHAVNFDVVSSDDELDDEENKGEQNKEENKTATVENEQEITNNQFDNNTRNQNRFNGNRRGGHRRPYDRNRRKRNQNRELLTEKFAKERKLEIQKEIKAEKKRKPKNLLFTTGYSSEESLSYSEEEKDVKKQ